MCSGSVELYVLVKVKSGKRTKTVRKKYGSCVIVEAAAPAFGSCSLKLTTAAKEALNAQRKLKAFIDISSSPATMPLTSSVTIRKA